MQSWSGRPNADRLRLMIGAWLGPVNLQQVSGAVIADGPTYNLTCTGDGSPTCGAIAEGFTDGDGRKLPGLLASFGADPSEQVALAAFSAGGSVMKRMCLHPADRAQLRVVHSADASYEATAGTHAPVEGYARYMQDALTDPTKLFVATASANPNKSYGSGIEIITATRQLVEQRTGQQFVLGGALPGVDPQPAQLWRLGPHGNIWIAEYPSVPHGQHATLLAPQIWAGLIRPWLAGQLQPGPGPVPPGPKPGPTPAQPLADNPIGGFLSAALGALLGWSVVRWLRRRA